jgi:heme oxygenase
LADLSVALREQTQALHTKAEKTGFVNAILRGQATREGYTLYLRNLLPAYQAIERGLDRHRDAPGVRQVALPALYRSAAIEHDLAGIAGEGWAQMPLLPAGQAYADRVVAADGPGLIGHAYTRYLGDLNGGQGLKRLLARLLGLGPEALSLYEFPLIPDPRAFTAEYRTRLDLAGQEIDDAEAVVEEAVTAFRVNIALSEAVQAAAG